MESIEISKARIDSDHQMVTSGKMDGIMDVTKLLFEQLIDRVAIF